MLANPFRGLRPFEPDEDHLFFGRERETDDLLRRLRSHRFLSVVGTSGSGKSSLVRCGLIPSLHSGFMGTAGSSWRVALFRPGDDPIGRLAEALDTPDVLGSTTAPLASTNRVLLEATLRRSTLGLVDAVRFARIPRGDNILILVDQFEELFRFRQKRQIENSRDESIGFVKLLLEAAGQADVPLYVVLTMRSDFIGDCMNFPGLPEAVNEGQYLVPRMTRDELRAAITGPVAVAGGSIAPRLVLRLLNDAGDDVDQLPLVQHVLMRSWDHWAKEEVPKAPIDLVNYEAVGTLKQALSLHAEEAFQETVAQGNETVAERVFKALTDTFSDPRGIRRPTSVADLAAICEASESRIVDVVEVFRRAGRSFLMPPPKTPLTSEAIVDVSHESLMRCWTRLITWAQEERTSAAIYSRLSREASWHQAGEASLWNDPELEIGLRWRRDNHPSAAWAQRYDDGFDRAMQFLDLSEAERERQRAERRARRIRRLALAWGSTAVLLVVTLVVSYLARIAARERKTAEQNLSLAHAVVNNALAVTDRPPELIATEPSETQLLRRELLTRAKNFYFLFTEKDPTNEQYLKENADAHFSLGHMDRALGEAAQAEAQYKEAAKQYESLTKRFPSKPEYKDSLAKAYNWLGETLRPLESRRADAEQAYKTAIALRQELSNADPSNVTFKRQLAQSYFNRGILLSATASVGDASYTAADDDFRKSIALLEPLARPTAPHAVLQDFARSLNNLASLLAQDDQNKARTTEAISLYERAIQIHENLARVMPGNREYKLELARFVDNLAYLLDTVGQHDAAIRSTQRALDLLDDLTRPTPWIGIEHADAHNLRAHILQGQHSAAAVDDYREALAGFKEIASALDPSSVSHFHDRFWNLLDNLASFRQSQPSNEAGRRVLNDALTFYENRGREALRTGARAEVGFVLGNLGQLLPQLSGADRSSLDERLKAFQRDVDKSTNGK